MKLINILHATIYRIVGVWCDIKAWWLLRKEGIKVPIRYISSTEGGEIKFGKSKQRTVGKTRKRGT